MKVKEKADIAINGLHVNATSPIKASLSFKNPAALAFPAGYFLAIQKFEQWDGIFS